MIPKTLPASINWFPANLSSLNRRFEHLSAQDLLRWSLATYSQDIVLATGFGPTGVVLMHIISQIRPQTAVFYLQTDLFFAETLALRDKLAQQLGLNFIEVHAGLSLDEQAKQYGPNLWQHNANACCQLRKVNPLRKFLSDKKAWITGIRRDQSATRRDTPLVSWDNANHLLKICPVANWTHQQVWDYIYKHNLPYNKLHDEGYPSIGCQPCTRATLPNETDERAGRWANLAKTECGIHIQNGPIIHTGQLTVTVN